jgi:hypothetical protein
VFDCFDFTPQDERKWEAFFWKGLLHFWRINKVLNLRLLKMKYERRYKDI